MYWKTDMPFTNPEVSAKYRELKKWQRCKVKGKMPYDMTRVVDATPLVKNDKNELSLYHKNTHWPEERFPNRAKKTLQRRSMSPTSNHLTLNTIIGEAIHKPIKVKGAFNGKTIGNISYSALHMDQTNSTFIPLKSTKGRKSKNLLSMKIPPAAETDTNTLTISMEAKRTKIDREFDITGANMTKFDKSTHPFNADVSSETKKRKREASPASSILRRNPPRTKQLVANPSNTDSNVIYNSNNKLEKSFKCDQKGCKMRFNRKRQLASHKKIHKNIQTEYFSCPHCDVVFIHKADLQCHIKAIHFIKLKKFACPDCEDVFSRKGNMIRHQNRKHLKLRPLVVHVSK